MKETIALIAALTVLLLIALEAERQRKARHRKATNNLLSSISSINVGLEHNATRVDWR